MGKLFFIIFLSLFICSVAVADDLSQVKAQLSKVFPNFAVESVNETPVPGLYEVIGKSGQIVYWSPKGYLIFGEIWTTEGKSLTAERRDELFAKKVKSIDLSQAVKIGSGKTMVITFTDPSCPFCKRGYQFLSKRDDITEYLFLLPYHHDSSEKIAYILCSKDKKKAYDEMMTDKPVKIEVSESCKQKAKSIMDKHVEIAKFLNVQGTPTYFINYKPVYGANIPLIEKVLNENKESNK